MRARSWPTWRASASAPSRSATWSAIRWCSGWCRPTTPGRPARRRAGPPIDSARAEGNDGTVREKRPGSRIVVAVVVAAIGAAAAYVFAPSALWETFPFERAELGAVAPVTLVADRDYDVLDEATTRRMREEAVAAVRAVYVHDATAIDSITSRIRQGFAFARSLLEAGDAGLLDAEREALERLLGARLENRELETLAANGFSREVEEGVVALVTQVMRELIVSDREELAQHRSRGI